MRKESGVTLIALVITIIVLIILAGVSITSLTDEDKGVVTKAKEAAVKTEEAAEQEDEDIKEDITKNIYWEVIDIWLILVLLIKVIDFLKT